MFGCERPEWHYITTYSGGRWQIIAEIEGLSKIGPTGSQAAVTLFNPTFSQITKRTTDCVRPALVAAFGIRHIDFHPDVFARVIAAESIWMTAS